METTLKTAAGDRGGRLDAFLARSLPAYSRSRLKRIFTVSGVRLDGRPAAPDYRLRGGEEISLALPDPDEDAPAPEAMALEILFEDADFLVLNKPPGLLVHPLRRGQKGTLASGLLGHCQSLPEEGGRDRPGIVHRLDRDTSGVMVAAKTSAAYRHLVGQFRDRLVTKIYQAVCFGHPPAPNGEIDLPLGRDRRVRTRVAVRFEGGRKALTLYRVIENFSAAALLEVEIKTGRTHQIRVHLAHLGCPVLGDEVYGRAGAAAAAAAGARRQMLHCGRLAFDPPGGGERLDFRVKLPADMESVLARLRRGVPGSPEETP